MKKCNPFCEINSNGQIAIGNILYRRRQIVMHYENETKQKHFRRMNESIGGMEGMGNGKQ